MSGAEPLRAGVMGWPVSHSLSPKLHGYWLRLHGIPGSYEALPVEPAHLGDALKGLTADGFRGVNLTLPHKQTARAWLERCDRSADRVGAVNLVVVGDDGKPEGHNTDAFGFAENIKAGGYEGGDRKCVIVGAGGAAYAAIAALADMGGRDFSVINRTQSRIDEMARHFAGVFPEIRIASHGVDEPGVLDGAGLLVNATSLGMNGAGRLFLPLSRLARDALVTDMVYSPLETALLSEARTAGYRAVDGLGMLLHQARPAFKAFFGRDVEVNDDVRRFVLGQLG